jgi:PadR family transcriptional regulator
MGKAFEAGAGELVQGTLEMLILRTLARGENHGFGIAQAIHLLSKEILKVEEGSLYPALRRLEARGLVRAEWGVSENNRRARFYTLTAAGRRQLEGEHERWQRLLEAISRVMEPS